MPDLDLPIGKVKRMIGSREETAEEYQKRVFPIIKVMLKKKSDAERFQRMRADAAEAKMHQMEQERDADHQRVEKQLKVLKNGDEQERFRRLQIDLQRQHDDEIGRLSETMRERAEMALKDDRRALEMQRAEVASMNAELAELKKQAKAELHVASLEAKEVKKQAEAEALEIVSNAKKEAEVLIAKAMKEEAVARLMERNAMRILRKERPDLVKDVEKRAWMELHAGIRKDRQDNQKDIGRRK